MVMLNMAVIFKEKITNLRLTVTSKIVPVIFMNGLHKNTTSCIFIIYLKTHFKMFYSETNLFYLLMW